MKYSVDKYYVFSAVLVVISLIIFFNPKVKSFFTSKANFNTRTIFAKLDSEKLNEQVKYTFIKVKQDQKLYLEIYVHMNHGLEIIEKLILEGEHDAHIILKDRTSNLLISNVDRDPDLEIIAPTYDKRMRPILNVFKYDKEMEEFKRVNTSLNKPIL